MLLSPAAPRAARASEVGSPQRLSGVGEGNTRMGSSPSMPEKAAPGKAGMQAPKSVSRDMRVGLCACWQAGHLVPVKHLGTTRALVLRLDQGRLG